MDNVDEQGRPEPPLNADEIGTLLGFLDFQRATLAWKTRGLNSDGWRATVGASTMTLIGLVKHLALVEDDWFDHRLGGEPAREPWANVDWQADRDWEWHTALTDAPDDVVARWRESVARAQRQTAAALAAGGMDQPARRPFPDGRAPSLRWIVTHMIEEYARHNGHADLLRESVDGETGE